MHSHDLVYEFLCENILALLIAKGKVLQKYVWSFDRNFATKRFRRFPRIHSSGAIGKTLNRHIKIDSYQIQSNWMPWEAMRKYWSKTCWCFDVLGASLLLFFTLLSVRFEVGFRPQRLRRRFWSFRVGFCLGRFRCGFAYWHLQTDVVCLCVQCKDVT